MGGGETKKSHLEKYRISGLNTPWRIHHPRRSFTVASGASDFLFQDRTDGQSAVLWRSDAEEQQKRSERFMAAWRAFLLEARVWVVMKVIFFRLHL